MSAACRTCHAQIIWAKSATTGRRMPLDAEPLDSDAAGTFAVIDGIAWSPAKAIEEASLKHAVSMARAQELLDEAGAWHTSHFATCPQAAQHRSNR